MPHSLLLTWHEGLSRERHFGRELAIYCFGNSFCLGRLALEVKHAAFFFFEDDVLASRPLVILWHFLWQLWQKTFSKFGTAATEPRTNPMSGPESLRANSAQSFKICATIDPILLQILLFKFCLFCSFSPSIHIKRVSKNKSVWSQFEGQALLNAHMHTQTRSQLPKWDTGSRKNLRNPITAQISHTPMMEKQQHCTKIKNLSSRPSTVTPNFKTEHPWHTKWEMCKKFEPSWIIDVTLSPQILLCFANGPWSFTSGHAGFTKSQPDTTSEAGIPLHTRNSAKIMPSTFHLIS